MATDATGAALAADPAAAVDPAAAAESAAEAEFDAMTGRLGIEVPADLKGGVLAGYRGLRDMTALLRAVDTGRRPGTDDRTGNTDDRTSNTDDRTGNDEERPGA
ncbi:hypothetical protein ACSNOH_16785 [Streptomyces sp. URMC 127]|uniref:hypothetical protein n=1 Tax=Streptomyces sp. URMC 127 TaxID=3423402 RepID=UPI003F1A4BB3